MAKRLRCEALAKTTCEPEDKREGGRKGNEEKEEQEEVRVEKASSP